MNYTLKSKLSVSYAAVVLLCVGMISIVSNLLVEKHFREYVTEKQLNKNSDIVRQIIQQYGSDGTWNIENIQEIGISSLENGIIIKVKDNMGQYIWDATKYNMGMCQQMIARMSRNMSSRYPNWKGEYVESVYPLSLKDLSIGNVEIGYYGPFFYTDNDLAFINTLNRVLVGIGALSLILSMMLGYFMARRLSNPILTVTNTARKISMGDYEDRIYEKSNIKEINQLTDSINELAQTLGKQERLRKKLTSDMAHELRTPLATLQSHMEAMIDGIWKADKERLYSCYEEILRISRMVGDLEKLAKYESESIVLNKTDFDIKELVKNICLNFESSFKDKNIAINNKVDSQIVYGDKDKISQVIVNLLSNSLKYTPTEGQVTIEADKGHKSWSISVRDTGQGISAEDLPYVFERFYRADKSRNRMTGGSGIGLTIVKAIVEAHQGKIEINSRVGEGTEVKAVFPLK